MTSLTMAYMGEMKRTKEAVASHLKSQWLALPDYRDAQVQPFLNRVLPIVQAGQVRAVSLTDAFVSKQIGQKPIGLDLTKLTGAAVRNGVSPEEVYTRPFTTVWTSIDKIGFQESVLKGLARLMSTGAMDVAMSGRDAKVAYALLDEQITGWTRVADPGCCDYCQMLDGVTTGPAEPQPLHNNCGCDAVANYGKASTTEISSLSAGAEFGSALIEQHGELGLVITDKNYEFTGIKDLPASYKG